jgi:hypothetical protein
MVLTAEINGEMTVFISATAADTFDRPVPPAVRFCSDTKTFIEEESSSAVIAPAGTPLGTGGRLPTGKAVMVFERYVVVLEN